MGVEKSLGQLLHECTPRGPHIGDRVKITPAEFGAMRSFESVEAAYAPPYKQYRVLIGGKWHVCERQYQMGVPVYFANPITIVLKG